MYSNTIRPPLVLSLVHAHVLSQWFPHLFALSFPCPRLRTYSCTQTFSTHKEAEAQRAYASYHTYVSCMFVVYSHAMYICHVSCIFVIRVVYICHVLLCILIMYICHICHVYVSCIIVMYCHVYLSFDNTCHAYLSCVMHICHMCHVYLPSSHTYVSGICVMYMCVVFILWICSAMLQTYGAIPQTSMADAADI